MPAPKSVETALSLINNKSSILDLTVGPHKKITPGQEIPKADAQAAPELAYSSTASADSYIVICLDVDAPFPSFSVLSPILHWIQPGLKPGPTADGGAALTASDTPFVANYIGPAPPPISSSHRYIFLLYEQPADFDVKKHAPAGGAKLANMPRMRYDLGAFEKEAKLGPVIAANYFRTK